MRLYILFLVLFTYRAEALEQNILDHLKENKPTVIFPNPVIRENDPLQSGSMESIWVAKLLHASPFFIGDDGKVNSNLIDYFEYDRKQHLITLEISEAYFSDGTKITANDLAYSILRAGLVDESSEILNAVDGYLAWKNESDRLNSLPTGIAISKDRIQLKLTKEISKPFNTLASLNYAVVAHKYLDEKELTLRENAPSSGEFVLESSSEKIMSFKSRVNNDSISLVAIDKSEIMEVMPNLLDNHTIHIDELTIEAPDLKNLKSDYSSFLNINKRLYLLILDPNSPPFDDIKVRKYFVNEHRKTIEYLYGSDLLESSIFSSISPGYLSREQLANYALTVEEQKSCLAKLRETPLYFRHKQGLQGSELILKTLDRLNISAKYPHNRTGSIRWVSTGFDVFDLVNDLRDVFLPGKYASLNPVTADEKVNYFIARIQEDKSNNDEIYSEFNRYLADSYVLSVITNHGLRYFTANKSKVRRKEVIFSIIDLFRD